MLVREYLHLFIQVTKHGTYIDGFAGPQELDEPDTWAAKLVLEIEPRWIRHVYLFESDHQKVDLLETLKRQHEALDPRRTISVVSGDFNTNVLTLLHSAAIGEREATFCLLDQRTFECHWSTLAALATYKPEGYKIELFYFLAQKWMDRALAEQEDPDPLKAWWGRDDWARLRGLRPRARAELFIDRFRHELGYRYVWPWPILEREGAGAPVMYYMIHATDHPDAPPLMGRAYERAVLPEAEQMTFGWKVRPPDPSGDPDNRVY